jgi:predicted MarR family transcription regulator
MLNAVRNNDENMCIITNIKDIKTRRYQNKKISKQEDIKTRRYQNKKISNTDMGFKFTFIKKNIT